MSHVGSCASCGTQSPTICRRCMQYWCKACADAPKRACQHLLVRLTGVQADQLRRLPLPPYRLEGRYRRTFLALQRLGLAVPDAMGMLGAKLPEGAGTPKEPS